MQLRASDHNMVSVETENHQVTENKHGFMEKPRALETVTTEQQEPEESHKE